MIAGSSLIIALLFTGNRRWPHASYGRVAIVAGVGGIVYTTFSEWLNTEIRGSWAYTVWMPTLPMIGIGLSPFLQWMVVPPLAFWWAKANISPAHQHAPSASI